MLKLKLLDDRDVGRRVVLKNHKFTNHGKIKRWNQRYVYVQYCGLKCEVPTYPENLEFMN